MAPMSMPILMPTQPSLGMVEANIKVIGPEWIILGLNGSQLPVNWRQGTP
jgi:hypothetical protein